MDELKDVASSLSSLAADEHLTSVLLFFCTAYLFKQSFGIPGSALLVSDGMGNKGVWVDSYTEIRVGRLVAALVLV